jgi:hypothetical protein
MGDNNEINFREIRWDDVDWIHLAQDRDLENTVGSSRLA